VIHLGGRNGKILAGDIHDVDVGIDVSLDHQLPRQFVDGPKVTWLFGWGRGVCQKRTDKLRVDGDALLT
jgi:hypothetical protein